ncbi:MAG: hypothetical protein P1P64_02545 [Treponemataceae bacterium]
MQNHFEKLKKLYGNVRRSRGFYIYTEKGVRIVDMCMDGGRAVLGRRAGHTKLIFKQKLDKGLNGFFPTQAMYGLEKVCCKFFPNHSLKLFASSEKAFDFVKKINEYEEKTGFENLLWRPFANGQKDYLLKKKAFLCFPIFATNVSLVFLKKSVEENSCEEICEDDIYEISQALVFAITRGFYEILNAGTSYTKSFSDNETLKAFEKLFNVSGIYLSPKILDDSEYEKLFDYFLENKILISPNKNTPSVFPNLQHYSEINKALKKFKYENISVST